MSNVRDLLLRACGELAAHTEEPVLDSQVLLAHALGRDRSWLYAWPEHVPDASQVAAFERLVERRMAGHPIAHLCGEREFWSLRLKVSADTLIPRPETEQLVETALALALPDHAEVLDMGTGSGAIALALAHERPGWHITAVDRSGQALRVARRNAAMLGLDTVRMIQSDWFAALEPAARFDLIVANPPYVAAGDPHLALGDVRFEPTQALVAGADGLDDIRTIAAAAPAYLKPGGWLWLEHGSTQGAQVVGLLRQHGFERVSLRHDLAGHERLSGGRRPVATRGIEPG